MTLRFSAIGMLVVFAAGSGFADEARHGDLAIRFVDQGRAWTQAARDDFYTRDQGSRLIPLTWLKALRQVDGSPFLADALARYGYLPNPSPTNPDNLPVGFAVAGSQPNMVVGMTCAACHTRQLTVGTVPYRIDGGPAFADFQAFAVDLDAAISRILVEGAFPSFAVLVLGSETTKDKAATLHADLARWSLRFHTLVAHSMPKDRPWGPTRLDAIAMIYNQLAGLDLGPAPTFMLPENMRIGDAPARYPFLWNAARQDKTQWGGWAANGNDGFALARNIGEVIGVFATFHPGPRNAATVLDHDYISNNSANSAGLTQLEGDVARIAPPVWPFPVDRALAKRGAAIFDRPTAKGGCVQCHGAMEGEPRPPNLHTWKTTTWNVGTDLSQWRVVLRSARTGSLRGAIVPGVVGPLGETDRALNILKAVVTGTIAELQAAQGGSAMPDPMPRDAMKKTMRTDDMPAEPLPAQAVPAKNLPAKNLPAQNLPVRQPPAEARAVEAAPPGAFVYEARVLQGIWAAAPYLHNGSVPTLADLLETPAKRATHFKLGPAYDLKRVGLATAQSEAAPTLAPTGCEDTMSGDSNCGHDYGTSLGVEEKAALLEFLKTL